MRRRFPAPVTGGPPSISVVVPARNEEEALPLLLDDLREQTVEVREVIVAIGGFDVCIFVAEDQDYVFRLARRGRYAFVRRLRVRVSVRRF